MKDISRLGSIDSSSKDSIDLILPGNSSKLSNYMKTSTYKQLNFTKFFKERETYVEKIAVDVKVEFLKFGQIETKNEKFDAELLIECSWPDDTILFNLLEKYESIIYKDSRNDADINEMFGYEHNLSDILTTLNELLESIWYDPKIHWTPQIYIENALGELKEEFLYKMELINQNKSPSTNQKLVDRFKLPGIQILADKIMVRVIEKRKVKGVFYERLELHDFPFDVQELSINLASKSIKNDVYFKEKMCHQSIVNSKGFRDQQQWKLFNFVNTKTIESYDNVNCIKKPTFIATAYIARYPNYYIYNVYIVLFLITAMGFMPFSFDPAIPHFRAIVTAILINIFITLRWAFNQTIPSISYLTILDRYALFSFSFLIVLMVWHALIGSNLFSSTSDEKKQIDQYFLYAIASCFILCQCIFIILSIKLFLFRRLTSRKLLSVGRPKDDIAKKSL